MPGFIRSKAALPHREPSASKPSAPKKSLPSKRATPRKAAAQIDLTSSPHKAPASKSASIDLTSSPSKPAAPKPSTKKRASPDTPSSPSAPQNAAKKTRINAPSQTPGLPASLPANATDYMHDPSGLLPALMESYNVATMQIISSSKMSAKIARSLDTLVLGKIDMADVTCKPGLVVMYAKAATASKLISVVEVVKREVGSKGGKWYQYSTLSETMVVIPRKQNKAGKKGGKEAEGKEGEADEDEDDDEAAYFETMKTRQERVLEGTDRMRAIPVLTVYLSRVPIDKLKMKLGEQSNAK